MLILYHFNLCPNSRFIRLLLKEMNLAAILKYEEYWNRREEFTNLHPSSEVPLLIVDRRIAIYGTHPIAQFIIEKSSSESKAADPYEQTSMPFGYHRENLNLDERIEKRALVQSTCHWFCYKFYNEVSGPIIREKITKAHFNNETPNSTALRQAHRNLFYHLEYIEYLLSKMCGYLCGDCISFADLAAAAHLSTMDFLNMIDWNSIPKIKNWYALIKSRPSFHPLLRDSVPGIRPGLHYKNLDF